MSARIKRTVRLVTTETMLMVYAGMMDVYAAILESEADVEPDAPLTPAQRRLYRKFIQYGKYLTRINEVLCRLEG